MQQHRDVIVGQAITFEIKVINPDDGLAYVAPTIEAADFSISINNGGWNPLATLPMVAPVGSQFIDVTIAGAETTAAGANGRIKLRVKDNTGDQWIGDEYIVHVRSAPLSTLTQAQSQTAAADALTAYAPATALSLTAISNSLATLTTYVDTEVAAIKAKTDNLPTDPADASVIADSLAALSTALATLTTYVDTEVAAIKAKTDNLPTDPADASVIADSLATLSTALATLTTYVDTEVAAIKAKTDNLPTDPADASAVADAITAAKESITSALTATQTVQAIAQAVLKQSVTTVEDTADTLSLAAVILAMFKSRAPENVWTIYKTDGVTVFAVRSLESDSTALPVTGVA